MKKHLASVTTVLLYCLLFTTGAYAQQTGLVEYPNLGMAFTVPDGWAGQETEFGFLIGSYTEPGFISISTHEYTTLEQLKAEARAGMQDANGTSLSLKGDFRPIDDFGVGARFEGNLEWQPARAYVIGLINPHGPGVTIFAAAGADQYTEALEKTAGQIARSFVFTKPVVPPLAEQWKEFLIDTRLTYMYTYNSTGGGFSDKEEIDLCGQGFFNYNQQNNMAFDTGGGFGSSFESGRGSGTWKIMVNARNQPVLQLNFYSGEVYEYQLSKDGTKTMMNGKRYFRTTQGENAPHCY